MERQAGKRREMERQAGERREMEREEKERRERERREMGRERGEEERLRFLSDVHHFALQLLNILVTQHTCE